jgi:hypothetical protein
MTAMTAMTGGLDDLLTADGFQLLTPEEAPAPASAACQEVGTGSCDDRCPACSSRTWQFRIFKGTWPRWQVWAVHDGCEHVRLVAFGPCANCSGTGANQLDSDLAETSHPTRCGDCDGRGWRRGFAATLLQLQLAAALRGDPRGRFQRRRAVYPGRPSAPRRNEAGR